MWEGEIMIAFDTKIAKGKIESEPVQCSAMNAKPRGQTSESDIMVNGIKGGLEKAETRNFL